MSIAAAFSSIIDYPCETIPHELMLISDGSEEECYLKHELKPLLWIVPELDIP